MNRSLLVHPDRVASLRRRIPTSAILALTLLTAACSSGALPTAPDEKAPLDAAPAEPGWVVLRFTTPVPDDGVLQLTIVGGIVHEVELGAALGGYAGFSEQGAVQLLLTGAIATGVVARLRIPDVRQIASYHVLVGQVAARGTYALRPSLAGYHAEVVQ